MSYAVYLIHLNFAITYGAQSRKPFYVTDLSVAITGLGVLVIAFLLASIVTVMVEMPFLNLDKLLFPNHLKASESKLVIFSVPFKRSMTNLILFFL
jgi:peptidoglycan/LPS O-acetylase OafA/YrhL